MIDPNEESFIHRADESIFTSGSQEKMTEQTSWEIRKCQRAVQSEMEKNAQLIEEIQALETELKQLERFQISKENFHKMSAPERAMVFKGHVKEEKEDILTVVPQIQCPITGGSALITFESPEVAHRITGAGQHRVQLDDWSYVHVKAEPLELLLPSSVEFSLEESPRRVLLSGLPVLPLPREQLLDKLELFFSKRHNMGGEVERVEWLNSSNHVALTFVDNGVVERLVKRSLFKVPFGKEIHEVKVSKYIDGEITQLQFHPSVCARTVLLSGIPDVLDEELMHDALEIHFQKPSKGGGEVESIVYIPAGRCAVAVFEAEED
ncbi:interferon-induced 35 kDa protein isoform X1 [Varanus komodoensis]|uniref:interferon-induced 35 kDa protein isoform X1 n=1 Tax=Varanus komodoensis TaxID=61221 RepID=UPI001CF7D27A|nr:interferon-induced 35 kDa protein isoform X1 [Varanus komodoensis]